MDIKTSFATQTYAQARTAAAPQPNRAGRARALRKLAGNFAETLAGA